MVEWEGENEEGVGSWWGGGGGGELGHGGVGRRK